MNKTAYSLLAALMSLLISGCTSIRPELGQASFKTPDEAVAAIKDAAKKNDTARLMEILGPKGEIIICSGDTKADSDALKWFAEKADEKIELKKEEETVFVELGKDAWPFPVPLNEYDGKWFFHTAAGIEEIVNRRIGRNELCTIQVCRELVAAQEEFANMKAAPGALKEYAAKILSSKGKFDGLYWDEKEKPGSPVGAAVALASSEIKQPMTPKPYHGYFFKVLHGQSVSAPGGEKSYLKDGRMTGGFAFLAYPAKYGVSGIKTFIVSKTGVVFEKNLGPETAKIAPAISEYDPDDSWSPVSY